MTRATTDGPGRNYTVADFFCGCGGFSTGFEMTRRFDVVLGNDVKTAALHAFRNNHRSSRGEPAVIDGDIRELARELSEAPGSRIRAALERMGVADQELDCLIGGPPCQGFSQMRRSQETGEKGEVRFKGYDRWDEDPRNTLAISFLDIAACLRPKVLVIENVPQMLRHGVNGELGGLERTIRKRLGDLGYCVTIKEKVNAADYGVPQFRERAFVIASRIGCIPFPDPTHADPGVLRLDGRQDWVTVRDAIADLPPPVSGKTDTLGGGTMDLYLPDPSPYTQLLRSCTVFPFNHITRDYDRRLLNLIEHMQPGEAWDAASARMRTAYQKLIIESQQPGESLQAVINRLHAEGRINKTFFKRYYWGAYARLAWDKPASTITANANYLGSGRFTHPEQPRGVTMREAARLQSFPDDFKFITSPTDCNRVTDIATGMDMIGEAVPPFLSRQIATQVLIRLDAHRGERRDGGLAAVTAAG